MTRPSRMSRERWQVLEPLLDRALELASPQRDRFLDDTCAGDVALRAELDALLSACEHAAAMFTVAVVEQFAPFIAAGIEDPPTVLGRYQIIRQVGRGGMASVYLATDPKHGRQVAVKVLHAHLALLVGASRFAREIEIAARLSHPNILPLHDSSDTGAGSDSVLYYVTPFMTGESLRDRLRRGTPLPLDEVERLVAEIAGALDYAHRQGVVHCDIKPENILLQEGHAVVADFGIARVLSETVAVDPASRLGLAFGTPAYMSPEQAAGDVALDGRSDVYSLGCVLRDMLDPISNTTHGASSALAPVIARATAADRDARYATAGELARAFRSAGAGSISAAPRLRRRVATMLVVAVGILGALAVLVLRRERPAPNAYRVAVAPFDVVDTSLSLWSEGLVDVLSRNLDGAGPLTAVPPSLVVRRWQGRADVASVRALGVRTGASLVLYGGLLSAGDSVRVTVGILDTESGQTLGSIERRDLPERMDRLTDSLTLSVLRELGRARRIEASRANFAPTRSLVALKEYLQGEQFYRRADWDSAQQRYQQAADADSSFALAYHRLAGIADLRAPEAFGNAETTDLLLRASRLRRGASPGDSLLLHIDSLRAAADLALRERVRTRASVVHEATVQELLSTLAQALRTHPQDAELALLYALSRTWHEQWAAVGEVDDRSMLASYDAAIRLDSSFAPAYIVPIALAAHLDGADGARRYLQGYLSAHHRTEPAAAMRLAYALLDPVPEARPNIDSLLSQLSPAAMCEIGALLQRVPDDAETSVRMFRGALAAQDRLGRNVSPICSPVGALYAYLFRGHLREAARLAPGTDNWLRATVMLDLTRFNMVAADSTRALFARLFARAPGTMSSDAYRWWATDRDTVRIIRYIDHFRLHAAQPSAGRSFALLQRAAAVSGTAFLALARTDTAGAIAQLLAVPDSMQLCWSASREALADLLLKSGRPAQAVPLLSRQWAGTSRCGNPVTDVVWTMHRARAFDLTGRRDDAIASYAMVRRAWQAADAELQPLVREAEAALVRLRRPR